MNSTTISPAVGRAGAALILTLAMLVLLSGLVLAFLLTVRTEYGAAKSYGSGTDARLLADSTLNLVMGQIREATTQPGKAWISQPGLIRTFDAGGAAAGSYKLYSADSLVEPGSFDPATASDLPADASWKKQPALWTDLNAPVADLTRKSPFDASRPMMNYPIFDGNHISLSADATAAGNTLQMSLLKDGNADIEGFKVVDKYSDGGVSMPVKWLYMLKDGTLVPAKASGTKGDVEVVVPANKIKTAQGEPNTIIARVAFWTDDETAKVNINTASEGTYWDTPVGNGAKSQDPVENANYKGRDDVTFEWELAARQGAQKEYQRYPGHPATTCLSPIFGRQLLRRSSVGNDRAKMAEEIFKLIPRVSGAEYTDPTYLTASLDNSSRAGSVRAVDPVKPDGERLYATVDELLYNPNFAANPANPANRMPWQLAEPAAGRDTTREILEMSKFFLTANSKAPEQNLFNLPRISIWPEQVDESRRTAFDKTIAFCATIGDQTANRQQFFFTRQNGASATADLSPRNLELMNYLKSVTARAVPGWNTSGAAATNFSDKYGTDRNWILTEIFDYIRCTNLADVSAAPAVDSAYTQVKGSGNDFLPDKLHPATFGQVVPIEMPDNTRGMGRIATISELALVVTRQPDTDAPLSHTYLPPVIPPLQVSGTPPSPKALLQFALIPKFFCPMAGYPALAYDMRVSFSNIKFQVNVVDSRTSTVVASKADLFPQKQPTLYHNGQMYDLWSRASAFGGTSGWSVFSGGATCPADSVPPSAQMIVPLGTLDSTTLRTPAVFAGNVEQIRPVYNSNNVLEISGSVTVTITSPATSNPTNTTSEPVVQQFQFEFPKFQSTMPDLTRVASEGLPGDPDKGKPYLYIVKGPAGSNIPGNRPRILNTRDNEFSQRDVVRTLVATGNAAGAKNAQGEPLGLQGDLRLIAPLKNVPKSYFTPSDPLGYSDKSVHLTKHNLRQGTQAFANNVSTNERCEMNGQFGFLVQNQTDLDPGSGGSDVPYSQLKDPFAPYSPGGNPAAPINGVVNSLGQPGDWDNGPGWLFDGPYCNKVDEGVTPSANNTPYIFDWDVYQTFALQQPTFFSPNRMLPSAVMFGSLPTGVGRNKPWQTLLFRPAKYYLPGGTGLATDLVQHPGSAKYGPPDHLLLDLFWMPVVEPYAISEPFATAGKVNLNQQIVPFTNIRRDTALRSVLKSVKITAMNPAQRALDGRTYIQGYKRIYNAWPNGVFTRRSVDLDNTLKQIADRLDRNRPFISASEICDVPLVPKDLPSISGLTPPYPVVNAGFDAAFTKLPYNASAFDAKLAAFWAANKLTGDNALEKPYALIYPRLTTRSNSFTVHLRVQTLARNGQNGSYILKANQSQPTGEFRGSFLIERYLDANTADIYDAAGNKGATGLNPGDVLGPYRFRVVSSRQFSP
ncbi:MAG: Verru_Chthon cassette protein A [Chthoniobacter sp.]|nr:Verru_Chthon cassette protein A [Chthoniobacter sp.]